MQTGTEQRTGGPGAEVEGIEALAELLASRRRVLVLTGAGCSTESGIPDYRDGDGGWKRTPPVQLADFVQHAGVRRRYWARSLIGWERIAAAVPNDAHHALARLEAAGRVQGPITQNVDGLHQKAGSRRVIDLHGRLDSVTCLGCGARTPRAAFQRHLARLNPGWRGLHAATAPDGDVDPGAVDYADFEIPACGRCRGVLKPEVVFFGEMVPRARVRRALGRLARADALLVIGSSLMVWSGYRFVRAAVQRGLPVAAVNLGRTRADAELSLKVAGRCGAVLPALAARLGA